MSEEATTVEPLFAYRRIAPPTVRRPVIAAAGDAQDDLVELLTLHHAAMATQLSALVANLYDAFGHAGQRNAMRTLAMWCEGVLIAHATAIENTLFAPASTLGDVSFHIDRLRFDHASMRQLVAQIDSCEQPQQAVAAAQQLSALFDDHTRRAHRYLLEALSNSQSHDLASLVERSGALCSDDL